MTQFLKFNNQFVDCFFSNIKYELVINVGWVFLVMKYPCDTWRSPNVKGTNGSASCQKLWSQLVRIWHGATLLSITVWYRELQSHHLDDSINELKSDIVTPNKRNTQWMYRYKRSIFKREKIDILTRTCLRVETFYMPYRVSYFQYLTYIIIIFLLLKFYLNAFNH